MKYILASLFSMFFIGCHSQDNDFVIVPSDSSFHLESDSPLTFSVVDKDIGETMEITGKDTIIIDTMATIRVLLLCLNQKDTVMQEMRNKNNWYKTMIYYIGENQLIKKEDLEEMYRQIRNALYARNPLIKPL